MDSAGLRRQQCAAQINHAQKTRIGAGLTNVDASSSADIVLNVGKQASPVADRNRGGCRFNDRQLTDDPGIGIE